MNNTLRLNAFQLVRPRAGNVHLLLDSNGRQTVSLERRTSGITIENREQRLANEAKLARLVGGVR